MSYTWAPDGVRLHYTVHGPADGEPVLLIQGLGADARGWIFQRGAIGERYRVILFDNRGVGRSDKPEGPYDLLAMAGDALAVLDAAGVRSAHIVGASMGGAMTQILAVVHPDRVRSLVLACTACRHHAWRRELLQEWADTATTHGMRNFARANVRWLVGPRSLRRFWPAWGVLGPLAMSAPAHAFAAQVAAILGADDDARFALAGLQVPTLVLVGSQDILTPLGDAEEIAELIPDAELAIIRGAAHGFMVEAHRSFNRTVLDFLDRVTAGPSVVTELPPRVVPPDDDFPDLAENAV